MSSRHVDVSPDLDLICMALLNVPQVFVTPFRSFSLLPCNMHVGSPYLVLTLMMDGTCLLFIVNLKLKFQFHHTNDNKNLRNI
jgi:hypothetical protein